MLRANAIDRHAGGAQDGILEIIAGLPRTLAVATVIQFHHEQWGRRARIAQDEVNVVAPDLLEPVALVGVIARTGHHVREPDLAEDSILSFDGPKQRIPDGALALA